ncbi:MAG TPA: cytochrome c, partial [Terriglobales bacterium]|nr:cytochrome c [Terriglobales bacterium]
MKAIVKVAVLLMVLGLVLSTSALAAGPGADTFKAKCAMCHGADGAGKAAIGTKDLGSADVQKQTDAQLTDIITKGKPPKMPAYGGKLSEDEIKNLVAFIR